MLWCVWSGSLLAIVANGQGLEADDGVLRGRLSGSANTNANEEKNTQKTSVTWVAVF